MGVGGARFDPTCDEILRVPLGDPIASANVRFIGDRCAEPGIVFCMRPCATPLIMLEDLMRRRGWVGPRFAWCCDCWWGNGAGDPGWEAELYDWLRIEASPRGAGLERCRRVARLAPGVGDLKVACCCGWGVFSPTLPIDCVMLAVCEFCLS